MDVAKELSTLDAEEASLELPAFDENAAFLLGSLIRERALRDRLPIAIEVALFDRPLFYAALPGSTYDNREWLRRKANVVRRFHVSSLAMAYELQLNGWTLQSPYSLPAEEYAAVGGALPIRLRGFGVIGSAAVSGLPAIDDHRVVAEGLRELLARS
ncbi:MAG: heme-degrading domain-containing protein [Gammaproteobacteria bacterium]